MNTAGILFVQVNSLFAQLNDAISNLSPNQYTQRLFVLHRSSIGEHLRHIIELYQEMLHGYDNGSINYENRKRNKVLETDLPTASLTLNRLADQLGQREDKILSLSIACSEDDNTALKIETTFLREVMYNIEHTIHHMALIKIGFGELKITVADSFGVAPSTLKYRQQCAQ